MARIDASLRTRNRRYVHCIRRGKDLPHEWLRRQKGTRRCVGRVRPEKNEWNTIKFPADGISGPSPRSVSCLLSLKISEKPCLVTMFGEHDPSSLGHQGAGKMLADVWLFDLESRKWSEIPVDANNAPPARGWFDADVIGSNLRPSIVVHGGLAESNERLGDVWLTLPIQPISFLYILASFEAFRRW